MGYDLDWLDSMGLCHKCGKEKAFQGRKFCPRCLERISEENAKRYDTEKARAYQARRREIYQEKKSAGICVRCTQPATHGLYCYEHCIEAKRRSKSRAQKRKQERHDRGLISERRLENGLCRWCGKPGTGGVAACDYHRKMLSEYAKRGDKTFWKALNNQVFKTSKNS